MFNQKTPHSAGITKFNLTYNGGSTNKFESAERTNRVSSRYRYDSKDEDEDDIEDTID